MFIYTIKINKSIKVSKNCMNLIDIFPYWNLMKSHAPKFLAPFPTFNVRHHPIKLLVHFVTYQYHWHIKWMILEMRSVIRLPVVNIIYSISYVTSTYIVVLYLLLLFIHYGGTFMVAPRLSTCSVGIHVWNLHIFILTKRALHTILHRY